LFLDCVPTRFVLSLYYSAPFNTSLFIHSTNFWFIAWMNEALTNI
jgi:hypothetical protein